MEQLSVTGGETEHSDLLAAFWRWWTGELRGLIPQRIRARWRAKSLLPAVRVLPNAFALDRPIVDGDRLGWRRLGEVPREAAPRGGADPLGVKHAEPLRALLQSARSRRVMVTLPRGTALTRTIELPLAIEENLREAIEFEFDRLTPFRAEQVRFDAVILDRDPGAGQCKVVLAYAPRGAVDEALRAVAAAGAEVASIVPEGAETTGVNLLPIDADRARTGLQALWVLPWLLLALLASAAIALPIWQKRQLAIAIGQQTEQARREAQASDAVRKQVEELESQYNFVLTRKFSYPPTVQVLEELSRLFPDDTWLAQLDLRTTGRGKEMQRDVQIRGDTANAGRLISLLEGAALVADAAPRSPTLKLQPGPGEAFDLVAKVKLAALPPALRIGGQDAEPSSDAPPAPLDSTAASARAPSAAPAPAASTAGSAPVPPASPAPAAAPAPGAVPPVSTVSPQQKTGARP